MRLSGGDHAPPSRFAIECITDKTAGCPSRIPPRRNSCRTASGASARRAGWRRCWRSRRTAQAVTEIQWWHAMTGAQQRPRQRARQEIQRQPERLQGHAGLQGQLSRGDGRGDRRVPRRQRAAHPAGVRGRHGDDDGGQGRDQAGLRGDGRGRREVRSEGVRAGGVGLLHQHQGPDAVVPVQQLDDGVLRTTRTRSRRPGSIPNQRAADLARSRRGAWRSSRRRAHACPFTTGWQSWTQLESFSAWHNVPFATKDNGFAGLDAKLVFNGPLQVRHIENMQDWVEEGLLRLRRPQERAGGEVLQRRMRDDDDVVGCLRHDQAATPSSSWRVARCRTTPTCRARRRTRSSAARACGSWAARSQGRVQGRRQVLHVPVAAGDAGRVARRPPATCRSRWPPTSSPRSPASTTRIPGTDVAVEQMIVKTTTATRAACALGNFVQIRDIIDEELEPCGPARRPPSRRSTRRCKRGNEIIERFKQGEQGRERPVGTVSAARQPSRTPAAPRFARRSVAPDGEPMEKRARLRVALAAVRAGRAADRHHARLLLLAGGAGALPVDARAGRLRRQHAVRLASTISGTLFDDALYLARSR